MIDDLLPHYYEVNGVLVTYDVLRSIMVDGHECAWMEYKIDLGDTGRRFYCECDFTEGVAWEIHDGQRYSLDGEKQCLKRKTALHLRRLELRREYMDKFRDARYPRDEFVLGLNVSGIILDLIDKAETGEFIGEDTAAAKSWGGYFYLQLVADITNTFMGHLWPDVWKMIAAGKIGMEGSVITPYREPPPPEWYEYARITRENGWVGIASLPGNLHAAQAWKFEVLKPDGEPAYGLIPGMRLEHNPVHGVDADDIHRAEVQLNAIINEAQKHHTGVGNN